MNESFVKLKDELKLNKKEFLLQYERALGMNIKDVEFVDNNEIFDKMISSYKEFENFMNVASELNMTIEHKDFITIVEKKKGSVLKFQDTLTFFFNDGSHIRFSAFNKNGIEISRVWVRPDNHRRGFGSLLMNLLTDFIEFAEVQPKEFFLECTGAVGTGDNHQSVGIDVQTKFFRKFGFRVANGKGYPHYVTMLRSGT
jgi:GNAT superfamily N-acetyltransferase